jgi:phage repressor protein C with HTH and peptisase S24 domain
MRVGKELTLQEVSRRTGMSAPYLSLLERGLRRPTKEAIRLLAKCFGVDGERLWLECCLQSVPEEVKEVIESEAVKAAAAGAEGVAAEASRLRRIPVFGVAAGDWIDFDDGGHPVGYADDYIFLPVEDPNCFACKVTGDSMCQENSPSFLEGDVLVFSPAATVREGDFVFVRGDEIGATFKQAFFDGPAGTVRLCPLNRKYPEKSCPLDKVRMYKMVFHVRKF